MDTKIDSIRNIINSLLFSDNESEELSDLLVALYNAEFIVNSQIRPSGYLANTPIPQESKDIEAELLERFKEKSKHDITKDNRITRIYNWIYAKDQITGDVICPDIAIKFALNVLDQIFDSDFVYPFATREEAEELFASEGGKNGIWRLSGTLPLTLVLTAESCSDFGISHYTFSLRKILSEGRTIDNTIKKFTPRVPPIKYASDAIDEAKAKRRRIHDSDNQ